jgi:hypothetical protein
MFSNGHSIRQRGLLDDVDSGGPDADWISAFHAIRAARSEADRRRPRFRGPYHGGPVCRADISVRPSRSLHHWPLENNLSRHHKNKWPGAAGSGSSRAMSNGRDGNADGFVVFVELVIGRSFAAFGGKSRPAGCPLAGRGADHAPDQAVWRALRLGQRRQWVGMQVAYARRSRAPTIRATSRRTSPWPPLTSQILWSDFIIRLSGRTSVRPAGSPSHSPTRA